MGLSFVYYMNVGDSLSSPDFGSAVNLAGRDFAPFHFAFTKVVALASSGPDPQLLSIRDDKSLFSFQGQYLCCFAVQFELGTRQIRFAHLAACVPISQRTLPGWVTMRSARRRGWLLPCGASAHGCSLLYLRSWRHPEVHEPGASAWAYPCHRARH